MNDARKAEKFRKNASEGKITLYETSGKEEMRKWENLIVHFIDEDALQGESFFRGKGLK